MSELLGALNREPAPAPAQSDGTKRSGGGFWIAALIPLILFVAALALFLIRLATPHQFIYDEVYHVYTAQQYLLGNHDAYVWYTRASSSIPGAAYEWTHPPLGKLIIAASIKLMGDNSLGWRFASAIFGAVGVVVAYLLALQITKRQWIAGLAAGFLLVDGLYFVQSRIGTVDIFIVVFTTATLASFYGYLTSPPEKAAWPLIRTGILMGLAIAVKWNAVYMAAFIGIAALWRLFTYWRASGGTQPDPDAVAGLRQHLVWIPAGLIILPLAIYVTSYIPFLVTGHSISEFFQVQRQMFLYHTGLEATHAYASRWWSWPLALRPVWYYTNNAGGMVSNIYANGNPILFWTFIPSLIWVTIRWWRTQRLALLILLIGFFGQWLPWALSPRIAFIYHYLLVVPFGCLALAVVVGEIWGKGGSWRFVSGGIVAMVVAAFIFFFPIYSAIPLTPDQFALRIWIPSWR
ncbi:MAG TPA: phospholipid carrier-dependent glycosyltransferase [Nitrolancea sp.]|nr:phospholipid carrier-dependent glycosyltransferase [Nitrolancea sp.]